MSERTELLQGTMELLILSILSHEPMHGWGITQRIEQLSRSDLLVNQGTLYPALERMRRRGWIRSDWQVTENNRRARYYELTPAGRRQVEVERANWARSARAVDWILEWKGGAV